MRELGIAGVVRGKVKRTTVSDPRAERAPDLVEPALSPAGPIGSGSPTSPVPPPGPTPSMSPLSSTSSRGGSSAGARTPRCAPIWCSMPWRWPSGPAMRLPRALSATGRRQSIPRNPLHRAPWRDRRRALDRPRRRPLRQCPRRVGDRPVQDRAAPPPRPLAQPRPPRAGDPRVGRLVQPPPPSPRDRRHPAGRVRGQLQRSARDTRTPENQLAEPPGKPGRFRPWD